MNKASIEDFFQITPSKMHSNQIVELPTHLLDEYTDQPFKAYKQDKLLELAKDIERNGLLHPIVVRKDKTRYQILSGHNRVRACKINQYDTISAIIKDVSDEEAKLILVQSNLLQRQKLSPKEKAFAYKLRNDALKEIGKTLETPHRSLEILAKDQKESERTIARYIKATRLIEPMMERFDQGKISLPTAERIAGLSKTEQLTVDQFIRSSNGTELKLTPVIVRKICELPEIKPDALSAVFLEPQDKPKLDHIQQLYQALDIHSQSDKLLIQQTIHYLQEHHFLKKIPKGLDLDE